MTPDRQQQLQELYDSLPQVACKRLCSKACGPIAFKPIEQERLQEKGKELPTTKNMTCSKLALGMCGIYGDRPAICRLYGVVDDPRMRCQHGCVPDRWMSTREVAQFLDAIAQLLPGEDYFTITPEQLLETDD